MELRFQCAEYRPPLIFVATFDDETMPRAALNLWRDNFPTVFASASECRALARHLEAVAEAMDDYQRGVVIL